MLSIAARPRRESKPKCVAVSVRATCTQPPLPATLSPVSSAPMTAEPRTAALMCCSVLSSFPEQSRAARATLACEMRQPNRSRKVSHVLAAGRSW